MKARVILDTGPLVALLNARDAHHAWAREAFADITPPLATCEAVLSDACYLLGSLSGGREAVLDLLGRSFMTATFQLQPETTAIRKLIERYRGVPMSLADACLVRMCELDGRASVITLDRDFRIYRANGRRVIPVIMPSAR